MEALTGFMIAGFIVFSGKLISSGELGVNNFFSFLAAMMLAYQPISSLATINMAAYQGAAAFERVSKIIDKRINIKENSSLPILKIEKSEIKFKNVGFKYDTTNEKAITLTGTGSYNGGTIKNTAGAANNATDGDIESAASSCTGYIVLDLVKDNFNYS